MYVKKDFIYSLTKVLQGSGSSPDSSIKCALYSWREDQSV